MVGTMALSKRNSRSIVVDGAPYRWAFSMDSGYATIAIQHGSGSGQRLEAQTGSWVWGERRTKSPATVSSIIRFALEQGWEPTHPGPPLQLRDLDEAVHLS